MTPPNSSIRLNLSNSSSQGNATKLLVKRITLSMRRPRSIRRCRALICSSMTSRRTHFMGRATSMFSPSNSMLLARVTRTIVSLRRALILYRLRRKLSCLPMIAALSETQILQMSQIGINSMRPLESSRPRLPSSPSC